jgi:serine protease Do
MSLQSNQTGVLVEQVQSGSPAASAGLVGGSKSVTINGESLQVGGDVIIAVGRQQVTTMQDLTSLLSQLQPGDRTTLTILRNGRQTRRTVTLGQTPSTTQ